MIARRELASLKSEKTIVLALLIQLVVAAFSSFLVVGLVSLYEPTAVQGFSVDVAVAGNASDDLLAAVDREPGIDAHGVASPAAARERFERDPDLDGILVGNWSPQGRLVVTAVAPDESIRTTLIVVKMRDVLESMERDLRTRYVAQGRIHNPPLAMPDATRSSPYFGFTYTVLIPLLMFLPPFISGSIVVDSLTEEVQQGTLELLRVAPVTFSDIVDAKMLSTASLAPVQAALWLALLGYQGTAVTHPVALIGMVTGIAAIVVSVGVGISVVTPDRRQAQFLYSATVIVAAALATTLPEHPANTIAKLAIGSPTVTTWTLVIAYLVLGPVAWGGVRVGIRRIDEGEL